MGVQRPRSVYTEGSPPGAVWATAAASRGSLSPVGAAEGEPGRRRAFDDRSRAHDAVDSAKVCGIAGGGVHQRGECDPLGAGLWERKRNFVGQSFWARGYYVSTVGRDETVIREYIRNQEHEDERLDQLNLWR